MPASSPGDVAPTSDHGGGVDLASNKGVLRSLSEGVRTLLVLDEKLVALGKEADRSRTDVRALQEAVYRLIGKIEEQDKRLSERFGGRDKRLGEMDERIAIQVELAVRNELDRRAPASLA
jgi:recombinational DNA repair ATPase RecF